MLKNRIAAIALALLPFAASAVESTRIAEVPDTPAAAESGLFAQAQELALRALGFIGVPYKWGGSSPDTGFDCSGLIRFLYAQITGQTLHGTAAEISRVGEIIDQSDLQPGDLVFFNTLRRPFSHVGIYLGDSRFVHAPSRGGVVEIVDMRQRYWKNRYNGARRLPI
ncbi:MAG: C40 family peptidase [Burkholderiales bacterium]|nr:C40 family peptidase [Burkholderiales bacterium]